jgi:GR25 family glycosyltransferase involved in LPS biosynthesis
MIQPICYVIAHPTSRVIDACVASLKKHNWKFEIFNAVDGNTVTAQNWNDIVVVLSSAGKMSKRPGAQGCWMSHWQLWNHCVKINEPIVIMEHDAVANAEWPEDLDINNRLIKLYSTAECKVNPAYGLWSKGAHAYVLTPTHARILIDYARVNGAQAVDKHLGDLVLPWTFLNQELVTLNPNRGPSSTSPLKKLKGKL